MRFLAMKKFAHMLDGLDDDFVCVCVFSFFDDDLDAEAQFGSSLSC